MCGVIGVYGQIKMQDVGKMLGYLTHRGQDASGIAWIEKNELSIIKDNVYPSKLTLPERIVPVVIGSTRYPTFGVRISSEAPIERFAQPFSFPTSKGEVATVHNGQLVNLMELAEGEEYLSDSELICRLLSEKLNENENYPDAINELMDLMDGSYSEICIINTLPHPTMLVFRDPLGIRPLIMGKVNETYLFASESIVIEQMGGEIIRDINPGELIVIQKIEDEVILKEYQLQEQPAKHCMFEYVYFASPSSTIDERSVYDVRTKLGERLAAEILKRGIDIDYVVPVPDSSRIAAQKTAELVDKPFREAILKNRYYTSRTFILNSSSERKKALESKYIYVSSLIKGKKLLVIDDSIVRGKTSQKIIDKLRSFGAEKIIFASTCPPLIRPCYYGIDMALDSQFIARNKSLNELQEVLEVELIIYQGIGDLFEAINRRDLCTACITGEYPTNAGKRIRKLLNEGKIDPEKPHYEQLTS